MDVEGTALRVEEDHRAGRKPTKVEIWVQDEHTWKTTEARPVWF